MIINMFAVSALFTSTIEALASTTDETTTTKTFSMPNSETETPTTTTAGDITTTTEAYTTSATSTCTPPKGTVCRRQGYCTTNNSLVGLGRAGTVAEYMQSCLDSSGCVIATFEQDSVCELWSKIPGFDDSETNLSGISLLDFAI